MLTHYLDIIGACLAFLATLCFVRINIFAWPISLAAIGIDMFLYGRQGIYGDMSLNLIYLLLTLYGWYQWKFGGEKRSELPVSCLDKKIMLLLAAIALIGTTIIYFILINYTNSQIPFLDALTTVISLIAQWLICRKIIECWALWFFVDSIYIGIYFYKDIPAHAFLNIIYLGLAIAGYLKWRKDFRAARQLDFYQQSSDPAL